MQAEAKRIDGSPIELLYQKLLGCWNSHDAHSFAQLFTASGNTIGFDASQLNGRQQIKDEISRIFAGHTVASYVGIVKEVRQLSPAVFILRAVAGMVPPGEEIINPAVNVVQTLIAVDEADEFRIALFQNTPAAFHGRPELNEQLTKELQEALKNMEIRQI